MAHTVGHSLRGPHCGAEVQAGGSCQPVSGPLSFVSRADEVGLIMTNLEKANQVSGKPLKLPVGGDRGQD